jgi:hypothetical protein
MYVSDFYRDGTYCFRFKDFCRDDMFTIEQAPSSKTSIKSHDTIEQNFCDVQNHLRRVYRQADHVKK